jgi:hypothetical protein
MGQGRYLRRHVILPKAPTCMSLVILRGRCLEMGVPVHGTRPIESMYLRRPACFARALFRVQAPEIIMGSPHHQPYHHQRNQLQPSQKDKSRLVFRLIHVPRTTANFASQPRYWNIPLLPVRKCPPLSLHRLINSLAPISTARRAIFSSTSALFQLLGHLRRSRYLSPACHLFPLA